MLRRFASGRLEDALLDTPAVMVVGPRQSGKSTVVQAIPGRRYVTLDDPMVLQHAHRDPGGFLDAYGDPLTIDEIQRAPELLLPMKLRIDRDRRPGRFLMTGSANVFALPKVADSLAGRMEVIDLPPLTQAEIEGRQGHFVDALVDGLSPRDLVGRTDPASNPWERIECGGFPEPVTRVAPRRRSAWFSSYLRTILERDVRDLANIAGLTQLPRVLSLLAARNGDTLNLAALVRDTGIAHTTLTRYLDLLRAVNVINLVPAWSVDASTRFQRTARAYVIDTGLACALIHQDASSLGRDREMGLRFLKAFVANELSRQIAGGITRPYLLHLRTIRQKEVDFVLEAADGRLFGIEVTDSTDATSADLEGLEFFAEAAESRFQLGIILTLGTEVKPLGPGLWAVPLSALWCD